MEAAARILRERDVPVLERLREALAPSRRVLARFDLSGAMTASCAGRTAIPPGFADAGVLVPIPGAPLGVALGLGGNPRYGKIDPQACGASSPCSRPSHK